MENEATLYDHRLKVVPTNHREGYEVLMKNLNIPFNSERMVVAFENLTEKLRSCFSEYDTIVGDDVSGRLPTLVFANLLRRKRTQQGLCPPRVFFVNAGSNLSRFEESVKTKYELSLLIDKKMELQISKILVVTEHVCTGTSMKVLIGELNRHGLAADAAVLSLTHSASAYGQISGKLYFGNEDGDAGVHFYNNPSLSGVRSVSATPISAPYGEPSHRPKELTARQDMKLIANYLWKIIE